MPDRIVADLLELLRIGEEHARRCEEHVDCVQDYFSRGLFALSRLADGNSNANGNGAWRAETGLKRFAQPVQIVTIERQPDRSGLVAIDNNEPIELSSKLARFLLFAASGEADIDGVVSQRCMPDATQALRAKKHTITNWIYRLRCELERNGWNPYLLETSRSSFRFLTRECVVTEHKRRL